MRAWLEAESYHQGYADGRQLVDLVQREQITLLEEHLRLARRWILGLALALIVVLGSMAYTKAMRVW